MNFTGDWSNADLGCTFVLCKLRIGLSRFILHRT